MRILLAANTLFCQRSFASCKYACVVARDPCAGLLDNRSYDDKVGISVIATGSGQALQLGTTKEAEIFQFQPCRAQAKSL